MLQGNCIIISPLLTQQALLSGGSVLVSSSILFVPHFLYLYLSLPSFFFFRFSLSIYLSLHALSFFLTHTYTQTLSHSISIFLPPSLISLSLSLSLSLSHSLYVSCALPPSPIIPTHLNTEISAVRHRPDAG